MQRQNLLRKLLGRLLRPLSLVHYELLFGRRLPFVAAVDRWFLRLDAHRSGGDRPVSRATWEEQYGDGRWDYLRSPGELARYGVLIVFLEHLANARTILDVGCGSAILRDLLADDRYRLYLGVDLSVTAIAEARRGRRQQDRFVVADAERWASKGRFDAVVINESLYYFHDPVGAALRYLELLREGGVMLISVFESPRTRALLRALERRLPGTQRVRVSAANGVWSVAAFRRLGAALPSAPSVR